MTDTSKVKQGAQDTFELYQYLRTAVKNFIGTHPHSNRVVIASAFAMAIDEIEKFDPATGLIIRKMVGKHD